MNITSKQEPILYRIDCSSPSRWLCNPAPIIMLKPVGFIGQWKYVCSFEASPEAIYYLLPCNNTSTVSHTDSITESHSASSRRVRNRANQPRLIVDQN